MLTTKVEAADPQSVVNAYFRKEASYWAEIYERSGIAEAIHQERLRATFALVDSLGLPPAARALDVGCGAGWATAGLARRGLVVDSMDSVQVMIDATRDRAVAAGVGSRVTTGIGDIHAIPFPDETFDLVVALGVLPWLPGIDKPLRQMTRVLRPGGHMIVSVDAQWQLRQLFDPFLNPLMRRPRALAARILGRPRGGVRSHVTTISAFRRALESQGLEQLDGAALGFGPFTIFKREALPSSLGLKLNNWLQSLANKGAPILRSSGSQYLVLAKKRGVETQE